MKINHMAKFCFPTFKKHGAKIASRKSTFSPKSFQTGKFAQYIFRLIVLGQAFLVTAPYGLQNKPSATDAFLLLMRSCQLVQCRTTRRIDRVMAYLESTTSVYTVPGSWFHYSQHKSLCNNAFPSYTNISHVSRTMARTPKQASPMCSPALMRSRGYALCRPIQRTLCFKA